METVTLTVEQFDLMLAMSADVGRACADLARAEARHSMVSGYEKRRLYRDLYAARKYLSRCEQALAAMRRRVGVSP